MFADYQELGVPVIGVSMDSLESHRAFAANQGIPFPLVADTDGRIAGLFGVDTSGGYPERVTFLIDREGRVARVWSDVDVAGHGAEVLAAARSL